MSPLAAARRVASAAATAVARVATGLSPMSWPPQGPALFRPPDVTGDDPAGRT